MSENNNEVESVDENKLIAERRRKLDAIREKTSADNKPAFPNQFRRNASAEELHGYYDHHDKPALEELNVEVAVAGRIMAKRIMGKASFIQIQDHTGRVQIYARRDDLPEGV